MSSRPHKQLIVWRQTILFIKDIYILAGALPRHEEYGLASQLKRASVSILLNIAEGAARQSKKEFAHFLSISQGSASEADALMELLKELNYIDQGTYNDLTAKLNRIGALLQGLQKRTTEKENK